MKDSKNLDSRAKSKELRRLSPQPMLNMSQTPYTFTV